MAQIVPKLNLNKTPALVENNSLIFAKNIRLDVDGTIHRDYGVFPLSIDNGYYTNSLVNYDNLLNKIIEYIYYLDDTDSRIEGYYITVRENLIYISGKTIEENGKIIDEGKCSIVGIIADSNDFYIFINGNYRTYIKNTTNYEYKTINHIIKYNEKEDTFAPCNCNWNWSGGVINGCVINNLTGDKILNIAESNTTNLVPLKSINLNTSNINDNESIYTQIPNIPLTNLDYIGSFSYVIPNGVYRFFVRYKISKDFYTGWIPASNEIFVGNKNNIITSFGTLNYTNTNRDSDNSFSLNVEHLVDDNIKNYSSYQIGFILTRDDTTYARAWKHFDFDIKTINFDYKAEDSEEIEVIDLLKTTYGLYNVGNITTFKNKLYISNYTETNFNDKNLQTIANQIDITLNKQEGSESYGGNQIITATLNGSEVISGINNNTNNLYFTGVNGIFNGLLNRKEDSSKLSISEAITSTLNNNTLNGDSYNKVSNNNGFTIRAKIDDLKTLRTIILNQYKNTSTDTVKQTYFVNFINNIEDIIINEESIPKEDVLAYIYDTPRFLTKNCKWVNINGISDDTIVIKIARKATITSDTTIIGNNNGVTDLDNGLVDDGTQSPGLGGINRPVIDLIDGVSGGSGSNTIHQVFDHIYYQTIEIKFVAYSNLYVNNDASLFVDNTTLIPYQKYKFYIHFVKTNGEITNGYFCSKAGELEAPYMESCNSVIYPSFNNITIPEEYVACFFSIVHTKVIASEVYNIKDNPDETLKEASSIDVNMMLVPNNKNIYIKQGSGTSAIETNTGKYYYSSDASNSRYFGADGIITFDKKTFSNNKDAYIINDYSISETENIELIKCTPYLNEKNFYVNDDNKNCFSDYTKMNLLGFICGITHLDRDRCLNYYSDGSSVYYKDTTNTDNLYLQELSKYNDGELEKRFCDFNLKSSNNKYIYSNYNLNYVALSEEPKIVIKTYYNRAANATTNSISEKDQNDTKSMLMRLIPSQLMSDVYVLPSMYKSYIRKTYSVYTENETTKFDNTVRSSILYGDENKVNILTFDANDYYNIPTNRGIIINMVSVGDVIIVHTRDSMFKFTGSNTLQSSDGEIATKEGSPFDTGVSEVFGSDFGFAGIQNKSDHIITELGYIFFDRDSRIVYIYSGQGQISKISDSIEKLFRHRNISNINFANDYYNNRFFMSIMFYEDYTIIENDETIVKQRYYPVTLSFNISEQIKSFVSLHDFYYHYGFNTKTKCYFLTSDNKDICTINKNYKGCYSKLELLSDKIYPQKKIVKTIAAKNADDPEAITKQYKITYYDSIIDIIENSQFETIKTLNAINWSGNKVNSEFANIDENNFETLAMAEDINFKIPCEYIRIYTDTCMTPLNPCTNKSNDYSILSADSYKYPRFNQGIWTFNYFRNILNSKNHIITSNYMSDDNSLIEGKYFVTRFIFDSEFKFETINFNYNIKNIF